MERLVALRDLVEIKHGFAFPGKSFSVDSKFPTLLTPGNFSISEGFRPSRAKTFQAEYDAHWELPPGSAVVTMTDLSKAGDTLGNWAIVPNDGITYLHNQRIGHVIVKNGSVDLRFLSYRMRLADYHQFVLASATGTTVRHTSPNRILEFELLIPELSEQRAIAEVLGALDDKIAANAKMLEGVRDLADAHFKRSATTTARLTDLARFVNGRNFTKDASGTGRVVVRIAELNSGIGGSTVYSDAEVAPDNEAAPGDILFAWSGSLTLKRWMLPNAIVNQHIFKVIPTGDFPAWLVFQALLGQMPEFRAIAADKATTMGHIQRKHLEVDVPVPTPEAEREIHHTLQGLWDMELAIEQESQKLAGFRDALLPALMDGRLRVRDAIAEVEDVL